jgi:hypothetical protein
MSDYYLAANGPQKSALMKPGTSLFRFFNRGWILLFATILLNAAPARAAMQFDVFLGYDGVVPEGSWFPVVCEIKNDGPTFTGVVEINGGSFNPGQTRRMVVELPTGTLKRLTIPVFSSARFQSSWDVRLLDEQGRTRAEQQGIRPRQQLASGIPLVGALPRTPTGVPQLRKVKNQDPELQPTTARLQSSLLPDNPIVFEGMDTIYLNSERAAELRAGQAEALMAWLNAGGHLIVGIEQGGDVTGVPWLRRIVPCDLTGMSPVPLHPELQKWLVDNNTDKPAHHRHLRFGANMGNTSGVNPYADAETDYAFEQSGLQVVTGNLRKDASALISVSGVPLVIRAPQGNGQVTALMFSPERKPFSDWKNAPSFWSKLVEVPVELESAQNGNNMSGGWSIDGVLGAMIDSRQIRKLPVEWLLLLLIVYLVVIGPLDQYWLKRIRRPMLTWITFPCYVVLFSLLIYFIGYKLRAGETEWNEIHLVDVLARGEAAELRGHTYASIYSPVNASYRVENNETYSTFRGEFQSSWNGGQDSEKASVLQNGDNFKAEIDVPVWTSQLYSSDWWQTDEYPLKYSVASQGDNWFVAVNNLRDGPLSSMRIIIDGLVYKLGDLPAAQHKDFTLAKSSGEKLDMFVSQYAGNFQAAAQSRQSSFGSMHGGHIDDLPDAASALSFISNYSQERFIVPPGLDMSPAADRNTAILLAWESGHSPIKPLNQFTSKRGTRNTLWRLTLPLDDSGTASF